ncbi:zinc metalloprotease [Aeoliella mucimassa]|uniref:Peptidase family M50 n=1 Tax=Aeoliella mucimassa TaxID=2527972 RepID=A0A518AGM5_9BACT|nr:hypothetical protein [Aeoliella mucimassa]QDU53862.1 Peptidase family M50 [Aeoliella mucimassa]
MSRENGFRWTIVMGRFGNTAIEVHLTLLLTLVVLVAYTSVNRLLGGLIIAVWLASVVLHQLAHFLVAYRMGGDVTSLVLGPAGGSYEADLADEPEPQVLTALAAPATHMLLVLAAMCPLAFQGPTETLPLLNPITGFGEFSAAVPPGLTIVKMVLWMNWMLFLVNLLPAYPFDAAIILRSLLWPMVGRRTAHITTSRLAQAASLGFLFAGLYLAAILQTAPYVWSVPLAAALYLLVASQRDWHLLEKDEHQELEEDWLTLENEIEADEWLRDDPSHMVLVEQHYDQLRERYERKRKAQEDYEDARVDDILARLHSDGFDQLSQDDQAFLRRASRRYRDRRRDRGEGED